MPGTLDLTLISATIHPHVGFGFELKDCYATVKCGKEQRSTKTAKDEGRLPIWNETFTFDIQEQDEYSDVLVQVFGVNFNVDELLGLARIPISVVVGKDEGTLCFLISPSKGETGKLKAAWRWKASPEAGTKGSSEKKIDSVADAMAKLAFNDYSRNTTPYTQASYSATEVSKMEQAHYSPLSHGASPCESYPPQKHSYSDPYHNQSSDVNPSYPPIVGAYPPPYPSSVPHSGKPWSFPDQPVAISTRGIDDDKHQGQNAPPYGYPPPEKGGYPPPAQGGGSYPHSGKPWSFPDQPVAISTRGIDDDKYQGQNAPPYGYPPPEKGGYPPPAQGGGSYPPSYPPAQQGGYPAYPPDKGQDGPPYSYPPAQQGGYPPSYPPAQQGGYPPSYPPAEQGGYPPYPPKDKGQGAPPYGYPPPLAQQGGYPPSYPLTNPSSSALESDLTTAKGKGDGEKKEKDKGHGSHTPYGYPPTHGGGQAPYGYGPPPGGYPPTAGHPPGGYPPTAGYPPPVGYPPAPHGYPPAPHGYPPQGYPPALYGHPPPPAGYPSTAVHAGTGYAAGAYVGHSGGSKHSKPHKDGHSQHHGYVDPHYVVHGSGHHHKHKKGKSFGKWKGKKGKKLKIKSFKKFKW